MAAGDLALNILIRGQDLTTSVIADIGDHFGLLGGLMAGVGIAAVGAGVEATKMAADFQTAMLSNVAHAGLAKDQFDKVSQSVLQMSTAVGRSPTELADALYPILSSFSGIQNQSAKSALALDTLKLSFEAVAGTTVDGTQVATAAVGTFNALGLATNNAAINSARMSNLMDIMDKTVQDGNMQWGAYQMVISKLATSIQGTGIKFTEASAALATLTNSGMTARQAQTYLANMFTTMAIKTDAMAKHAKALGISWDASGYAGMSLAQKIAYINQVTDGNKQKILALLGNNATALRSFDALSAGIQSYGSNLNDLNHAQGALKASFDTASQGFNFQMQQMKAAGDALMITIGTKLLPVVAQVVSAITPIVTGFTAWISTGNAMSPMLQNVTGMLGVMASNWRDFGGQIQTILAGPLKEFGQTMSQLLPGFISQFLRALALAQLAFQDVATSAATIIGPALKVLAQVFTGAQGTIETVLNAIEGQFLPALHNLVTAIAPVIVHVLSWVASSGLVPAVFAGISGAVSFLMPMLSGLINGIASFVGWMAQGSAPAKALGIALLAIGSAIAIIKIGNMIAGIIEMIPYMIMWVAVTWAQVAALIAEAIAEIAANWPIYLIIAAIALVIAIVVLLVQHWGQVVSFLRGTWTAFANWFMGAMRATGAFFVGVWNGIVAGVQAAVNFIVTVIRIGFALWLAYITFPIRMVVALFEWLYNHNYYFKALVDFIVNVFKAGLAWVVNAWQVTVSFLSGLWRTTASLASSVWSAVTNFISAQVSRASGFIRSVWSAVVGFLAGIWASISSGVSTMWGKVSGFFAAAWSTYISTPLHNLWNSITGFVGGWASQAVQWGVNLIKGFISGITSMIGAVGNAAHNVISTVAGFLGFHSPAEKGEGRYIVEWGAGMVKGFVSGMQSAMPLLNAQVSHMIQAPNSIAYGGHSGAGSGNAFALTGGQTIVVQVQPAKADISLDKKKVGEGVMQYAAREVRLQGGVRNK